MKTKCFNPGPQRLRKDVKIFNSVYSSFNQVMFRIKNKEHHLNGFPESNLGRITVDNKLPGVCVTVHRQC